LEPIGIEGLLQPLHRPIRSPEELREVPIIEMMLPHRGNRAQRPFPASMPIGVGRAVSLDDEFGKLAKSLT
jgi:hypothetical protein